MIRVRTWNSIAPAAISTTAVGLHAALLVLGRELQQHADGSAVTLGTDPRELRQALRQLHRLCVAGDGEQQISGSMLVGEPFQRPRRIELGMIHV